MTATALEIQGGMSVPVRGPKGSRLMLTPASSYIPTRRSVYCQYMIVFSREKFLE